MASDEQNVPEAPFVTWSSDSEKQTAFSQASGAVEAYNGIKTSASRRTFLDIEPNISVRPQHTRDDYYKFRSAENLPKNQKDIIKSCMNAYDRVGIIKNVIDLMGDFASQGVELIHPNRKIERFYRKWFKKIRGKERSERFLNTLYRCGNVVVKRRTAKISSKLQKELSKAADVRPEDVSVINREVPWVYDFLNPLSVDVIGQELALFAGNPKFSLKVSTLIQRMIKNPTEENRYLINSLPNDIKTAINSGKKTIDLDPNKTSVYYYKKDDWSLWAHPMIYAILDDIIMLEKMKLADMSALDGAISNIRLWTLGSLDHKILPTKAGINKLRNILASNFGGGTMDLVWGPEISFQESNTQIYRFLGSEKYTPVLNSVYAGLGIPPTLTGVAGNTGGFSNNFVSLKTLVERLEYGRSILMDFWQGEIERVQKAMGFRLPAKVHFDHISLSDEAAEKNLLIQLADRDIISTETLRERFGEMPDIERIRVNRELRERTGEKTPPKASPYHDPQHKQSLEKIALTKDMLLPEDVGLPPSSKPPVEETAPEPSFPEEPNDNDEPVGRPEDGRPKFSRDTKKRKQKRVLPLRKANVDFVNLTLWANDAQKTISDILNPALLSYYQKKNLRSLTKKEQAELEYIKLGVLCNLDPYSEVTADIINDILLNNGTVIPDITDTRNLLSKDFADKNDRQPTIDEMRQIQSSAYAFQHAR
tara:strand:- start:203 stop:2323 length:2121 start_codon:yes stop_codon:yes gene_type:complete